MTLRSRIKVALEGGRPGDIIRVEEGGIVPQPWIILPAINIGSVELFYDTKGDKRLLDRIYRVNGHRWGFVELGYGVNGTVTEARIVRKVTTAPAYDSLEEVAIPDSSIEYGDETFHYFDHGVSDGYLITPEGVKRDGQSSWVAFYTDFSQDNVQVLVYAWWEGGSGVYWGYVIPPESVSIWMAVPEI